MLKVSDLILKNKCNKKATISPYSSIASALQLMADEKLDALAVVDDKKIVGIIENHSILKKLYEDNSLNLNRPLFNIMEMKVLYATKDFTLEECVSLMSSKKIFFLPVLEDGDFVDMMSLHEISYYLLEDKEYIIANLSHYITGSLAFNVNTSLPSSVPEKLLDLTMFKEKYSAL